MSPDGTRVYVTGDSTRSRAVPSLYSTDYATIAYDAATGAPVWTSRYDGPGHEEDVPCCVAVSPDGSRVFVTGFSQTTGEGHHFATVAYDAATGATLWVSRHLGKGPRSITVSPDGSHVLVTGAGAGADYLTLDYNAVTGSRRWEAHFGPDYPRDVAHSVDVSPDGTRVYVTGAEAFAAEYITQAYDADTGMTLWTRRYPYGGATSLTLSKDGALLFVTGFASGSGGWDYVTIAYDALTGSTVWTSRFDSPAHKSDSAWGVAVSSDGTKVFVTGVSLDPLTGNDYFTIAYEPTTGFPLWGRRYNGPADGADTAHALAVSPDGRRVFVTGRSRGVGSVLDYATTAYDAATGATLWLDRYEGPGGGRDDGRSIVVSPDGAQVFVTGASVGIGTGSDFATVAYEA